MTKEQFWGGIGAKKGTSRFLAECQPFFTEIYWLELWNLFSCEIVFCRIKVLIHYLDGSEKRGEKERSQDKPVNKMVEE